MAKSLAILTLLLASCAGSPSQPAQSDDRPSLSANQESATSASSVVVDTGSEPAGSVIDPSSSLVAQARACIAGSDGLSNDDISDALDCFDSIRRSQEPLDPSEADVLREVCARRGGEACTELLLRSLEQDHQIFGLACGGRVPDIPCPEGEIADHAPATSVTVADDPAMTAAQIVDQAARGNVIFYSISEIGRPIYGWRDFVTITYCSNGTFLLQSNGERRTVLDNTEYRSDFGQGTWQVLDLPDGSVAVDLLYNDGRRNTFVIWVRQTGAFDLGPGVSAQLQGSAAC